MGNNKIYPERFRKFKNLKKYSRKQEKKDIQKIYVGFFLMIVALSLI